MALTVLAIIVVGCASKRAETAPAPSAELVPADSALHVGATVRVRGSGLGRGWRVGTVVVSAGALPCLAVKLTSSRTAAPFYVPLERLARGEADRRTNTGALTLGLPPAEATDWAVVDLARAVSRRCRRGR
jgi:hypothetical protein